MPSKRTGEIKIDAITWKKSKAVVSFSNNKIELSQNAFTEFGLYEGKLLSQAKIKEMIAYSKFDKDYEYAIRLLSRKQYSEMELRQKLIARESSIENRNKVITLLKKNGLISDLEYAKAFVEESLSLKRHGSKRICYELANKGIDEEIIKKLQINPADEEEAALKSQEMLIKRYRDLPDRKKREKIARSLYESGCSDEVIKKIENQIPTNDPKDESASLKKELAKAVAKHQKKYEGYELRERVIATMVKKGYSYQEIKNEMEEEI